MGMFDNIYCDYPLPDPEVQHENFQTKDLDCHLDQYKITKEGKLILEKRLSSNFRLLQEGEEFKNCSGAIRFYTSTGSYKTKFLKWYEYTAVFENGILVNLVKNNI